MAGEDACQMAIGEVTEKVANDTQLSRNVTRSIEAAKPRLNSNHGVVYVTVYARFFGADDDTCDSVAWAVWRNIEQTKQYLKLKDA